MLFENVLILYLFLFILEHFIKPKYSHNIKINIINIF